MQDTFYVIHENGEESYGYYRSPEQAAKRAAEKWGDDLWTIAQAGIGLLDPAYVESLRNQFLCVEA